jgi:3-isopropylmalate dehydrogenase
MPKVAVAPGDGVGKEVTREAVKALRAVTAGTGLDLDLVEWPHGADRYLETGEAITDADEAEQHVCVDPQGKWL